MKTIQTPTLNQATHLAQSLLQSQSGKIACLLGSPGTGKTVAGKWLCQQFKGVRVCARSGMSKKDLVIAIARGFDLMQTNVSCGTLIERIAKVCEDKLIVVDEANHLNWQHLELLRYLPDEAGASLLLIGTELLQRPFRDGRSGIYLAQLASRIGTKQLHFAPFKKLDDIAAVLINPTFGVVSQKTAKAFGKACGGLWRHSVELSEACQRIMTQSKKDTLSEEVVLCAQGFMAGGNK